jgi:putative DNA primase/helicase
MAGNAKVDKAYQETVDRIIKSLENGKIPWHKPWNGTSMVPHNFTTNKEYQGLNFLMMLMSGRTDSRWAGYKQAKAMGATVRAGEKSFVGFRPRMIRDPNGAVGPTGKPVMRCIGFTTFRAFNGEQMDGMPALPVIEDIDPSVGFEKAAALLQASGATVSHGGNAAFYRPSDDAVTLPEVSVFDSVSAYWATACHELVHWTGHASRLDRDGVGKALRTRKSYAFEELVAEMGSAFLCHDLGIDRPEIFANHEAYIGSWIRALDDDPAVLQRAASLASKAVGFLKAL